MEFYDYDYDDNTLGGMPDEMLVKIFSFLPVKDLHQSLPMVSRRFSDISKDPVSIRNYAKKLGITLERADKTKPLTEQSKMLLAELKRNHCLHIESVDISLLKREWKNIQKNFYDNNRCEECGENHENDLWICIGAGCQHVGCGRSKDRHALMHSKNVKHPLCLKVKGEVPVYDLWCYYCSKFIGHYNKTEAPTKKLIIDIIEEKF